MGSFFKESRDYSYAQRLAEQGNTLTVWLTDAKGSRVLSLLKFEDDVVIDGNLEGGQDNHINSCNFAEYCDRNFAEYCDRNDAVFLLPASDQFVKRDGVFFLNERDRLEYVAANPPDIFDGNTGQGVITNTGNKLLTENQELKSENALLKQSFDVAVESVKLRGITIAGLQAALELANEKYVKRGRDIFDLTASVIDFSSRNTSLVNELEAKIDDMKNAHREELFERDRTISNLKLELEQCKRQSEINDELRLEFTATFESYQNVLDTLRGLFNLPLKENYLDLVCCVQGLQSNNTENAIASEEDADRATVLIGDVLKHGRSIKFDCESTTETVDFLYESVFVIKQCLVFLFSNQTRKDFAQPRMLVLANSLQGIVNEFASVAKQEAIAADSDHELNAASQVIDCDRDCQDLRDRINCLIATNASFKDQIVDRDREVKSLSSGLMSVASRLGVSYDSDFFPMDKVFEAIANILEVKDLKSGYETEIALLKTQLIENIQERDRTIAILEDNLDRVRSEHLGQLRAVEQMLIVLKNNDLGEVGAYTAGAMKFAIAVIQNNIAKLSDR